MCEVTKTLRVTMNAQNLIECIDEMHDSMTPQERIAALSALCPKRGEIIELLRLDKETEENARSGKGGPAYWADDDLYKMLRIMFDPRGMLQKSQLAACVAEVIFSN